MQKRTIEELLSKVSLVGLIAVVTTMFAGCQVIGDIFKAGFVVGIVIVVVVIGLIAMVARMFKR